MVRPARTFNAAHRLSSAFSVDAMNCLLVNKDGLPFLSTNICYTFANTCICYGGPLTYVLSFSACTALRKVVSELRECRKICIQFFICSLQREHNVIIASLRLAHDVCTASLRRTRTCCSALTVRTPRAYSVLTLFIHIPFKIWVYVLGVSDVPRGFTRLYSCILLLMCITYSYTKVFVDLYKKNRHINDLFCVLKWEKVYFYVH